MVAYNLGTYEFKLSHTAVNLSKHITKVLTFTGVIPLKPGEPMICEPTVTDEDEEMCTDDEEEISDVEIEEGEDDGNGNAIASDTEPDNAEDGIVRDMSKSIYITTDNASNISKAVSESSFNHMNCFAHTINLAVQRGLKVAGVAKHIAKVRKVVKHFRKSNNAKYALEVRAGYIKLMYFVSFTVISA